MLLNYLKLSFRFIRKNFLLSAINIFSLAFGAAACILIFLFIRDEKGFEGFHSKKENIYRLNEIQSFPGTNTQHVALSMPSMGPRLQAEYPEVKKYSRFMGRGKRLFEKGDKRFAVERTVFVDSTFLEIFDFPLLAGDRNTALDDPNSILITEDVAQIFFGDENPVGESLKMREDNYKITGLLGKAPENSHLQYEVLISLTTLTSDDPTFNDIVGNNFLNTYLLMDPSADISAFESKMPEFLTRLMPPGENNGGDVNDFYKVYLQPLEEVHLASMHVEHDYQNYRKFNGAYLDIFMVVGFFILLIAGVNFMNLVTARASHRWKEIGVRKTVGAQKGQLFHQFVTESVILSGFAFIIGFGLAMATSPLIESFIGRKLSMSFFWENPVFILLAFLVTVALGFLAGIYPALYLASFKTIKILKGGKLKTPKSVFRSALVVLQFGLAVAMIISTLLVVQQLNFIESKDIGFKKDQIVLVDMNQEANQVFDALKEELLKSSNIVGVTASGQRLGNNFHQWGFKIRTDSIRNVTPSNVNVDYDYFDVYEIDIKKGRGFSREFATDNGLAYVINEKFAEELGLEEPVGVAAGHSWYPDDSLGAIIGVAEDFNFNSLHYDINTLAMAVHPDWGYSELSVKINGDNIEAAIADLERTWTRMVPSWPFDYSFLDEHFAELYRSEQQMRSVIIAMACLAILIACMGLFGLAAISMEKRVKEIGIRKILGASLSHIMVHLSKQYALLVALAFLIFSPLTWWLMSRWLDNFAFRININPLIFILGFLLAFTIALLTISYHTLRLAKANPIESLRYE